MLQVTFLSKKEIAKDTWEFIFAKPKNFTFVAGQFTTVFLGKENRDFTICATQQDKKYFSIITRSLRPGQTKMSNFKMQLFGLKEGSKISMNKPSGGFILHENKHPKIFLAGGIGVTVFYSIICSNAKIQTPLTLFASFSKKENITFQKELKAIQKQNKYIQIIYTLSQENWTGEKGRVSKKLIQKYVPHFQKAEYMIAGGEKMVADTEEMLLAMKIPQEQIRIDIFTGY